MRKIAILSLLLCLFPIFLSASVPPLINYRGKLLENNAPVNGPRNIAFKIYSQPTGSTALWDSGILSLYVNSGIYEYTLGSGTSLPTTLFTNTDLFLETVIAGTALTPREKLVTTPFSFRSEMIKGTNVFSSSGNVGIGTPNPLGPLSFNNALGNKILLWDAVTSRYGLGIQAGLMQLFSASGSDIAFGTGESGSFSESLRIRNDKNISLAPGGNRMLYVPDMSMDGADLTIKAQGALNDGLAHRGGNLILRAGNINVSGAGGAYENNIKYYAGGNSYDTSGAGDHIFYSGNGPNELMRMQGTSGRILSSGEIISTYPDSYRLIHPNYGTFWRNDGGSTYFMVTGLNDPYGGWHPVFRPIIINHADGRVRLANDAITASPAGNVGFGGPAGTWRIEVVGGAYCDGTTWVSASDRQYKTNISDLSKYGLKEVVKLRPVSYLYKNDPKKLPQIGLIAQETELVIPEVVSGTNGKKGLAYQLLVPVLVNAIKELSSENSDLKKKNSELEARLKKIEKKLGL